MNARYVFATGLVCLAGILAGPAWAEDQVAAPSPTVEASTAPAVSEPWVVTRHPVTDTGARVVDLMLGPVYWATSEPWWWIEGKVYRDEGLRTRVRLHMAAPTTGKTD